MGTTADKLQHLITGKQSVVNSVNNKAKTSLSVSSKWSDISTAIDNISIGIIPSGTLTVTKVGTYDVTNYASATFSVSTETKTITPTTGTQSVTPSSGKYLSKVTVNPIPSSYIIPSGTKSITTNGTHNVKQYANVNVNIATGTNTSDATAIASDILSGKTAYGASGKLTGTIATYDGTFTEGAESGGSGGGILDTVDITFLNSTGGVLNLSLYTPYYSNDIIQFPPSGGYSIQLANNGSTTLTLSKSGSIYLYVESTEGFSQGTNPTITNSSFKQNSFGTGVAGYFNLVLTPNELLSDSAIITFSIEGSSSEPDPSEPGGF